MNTPWGKSQDQEQIADGIIFYSTPSHGGLKVSRAWLKLMPAEYVNEDGWYEEDCEYLKVVLSFPSLFPNVDLAKAKESYEYWFKRS